jgi:hypothetical protein
VQVDNTDSVETLTLTALTDNTVGGSGDITTVHDNVKATTCVVPQTIAVGGHYQCTFDAQVCNFPQTDTVTGTLNDDENTVINPSGSATVNSVTAQ